MGLEQRSGAEKYHQEEEKVMTETKYVPGFDDECLRLSHRPEAQN